MNTNTQIPMSLIWCLIIFFGILQRHDLPYRPYVIAAMLITILLYGLADWWRGRSGDRS